MLPLDDTLSDLRQTIAALQQKLEERTAERDEALTQQIATSEILRVISRSRGDVQPVFEAIVRSAAALCEAEFSAVARLEEGLLHLVAIHAMSGEETAAFHRLFPRPPTRNFAMGRAFLDAQPVQFEDVLGEFDYDTRTREVLQSVVGYRSFLGVPILREGTPIGVVGCGRRAVRPFTATQIDLLKTFADQAAIAVENVRLFNELETRNRDVSEALAQQTATAEVLQVINSSPGDLAPVFNAMLDKAMRLCGAAFGALHLYDGRHFRAAATRGVPEQAASLMRQPHPPPDFVKALLEGEPLVHLADAVAVAGSEGPLTRGSVELGGVRTLLVVPLRKDSALLGTFAVFRQEVRAFTDKQIVLLQNFAAQAVIAIENARLLTETREALEQQTATAEVLGVINASPGDLAPVFKAILDKAHTLCGATLGSLFLYDGELFRAAATHGYPEDLAQQLRQGVILSATTQLLDDSVRWVHNPDLRLVDAPTARAVSGRGGVRTNLMLPLRKDGQLLGAISCNRLEVRPFRDKEIALLRNFAAQAVIAMENARLLDELRGRTRDLQESLEYQTATSDVLKVISQSTFDLQTVLTTVAETAARLCESEMVFILRRDGEVYRAAAALGWTPEYRDYLEAHPIIPSRSTLTGRVALEGRAIQIADITADPEYTLTEATTLGHARTQLGVPLMREGAPIGVIILSRTRVEPFTPKQIELVTTFADQAVIAIENTRLLTELREALEQQTATAEVLQVINSSPGDLAPVFDAMLEKAMRLCEAAFGQLAVCEDGRFRTTATRGMPAAFVEYRRRNPPDYGPGTQPARLLAGERIIHVPDLMAEDVYRIGDPNRRALVDLGGVRSSLMVPLLREETVLGFINLYRREPRPFSEKQTALLQSFAAQAVIAMDNARLLDEIRHRQAELRVTFDNMGDGVAMFDAGLRLAAWNLNFQRILDLPDVFLAERPAYADYIRILAERGEFGSDDIEPELSRRLEATDQELRLERTRPDGRVIEVRRNAVPGGGFVLIYSDITERKHAEEQIRAARDTAEAALRELKAAPSQPNPC